MKRCLIECLLNGIDPGTKYDEPVRMFALNMHYLSPRAYTYLRGKFDNNLPHTSTIRKWFQRSNASGDSGFHDAAFQALKNMAEDFKEKNMTIFVALSFDEMAIRRHVQWLHHKKKFSGFVNFATIHDDQKPLPVANNVIVILLNGINVKLTLPIANFFITTLIAEEKAILIASVLKALTTIGIRVVSVTSDGLSSNLAAYDILGASFTDENAAPYFVNPDNGLKVYLIHDPPHMLKLTRNCLGDEKILYNSDEQPIEWKFFERLYRSKRADIASHKLTKRHIDWHSTPMKVSLATETFSRSTALSIERLALAGIPQFEGSEGTSDFAKKMDRLFDVFNTSKCVKDNIFKSPITVESKAAIFAFLNEMIVYIDGLTLKGQKVTKTARKTGFNGFKFNIIALKMIYEELVETKIIPQLFTCDIQQDLLESFFGRIRSSNGDNRNPTQEQFSANFRRTLINKELTCSALSNCLDRLDILTVSSSQTVNNSNPTDFIMRPTVELSNVIDETEDDVFNLECFVQLANEIENEIETNTMVVKMGIASVAGQIEALIEKNHKFTCGDCATIFEQNDKIDGSLFVKNKNSTLPCESTYAVCKTANITMSTYLQSTNECYFDYSKLFSLIKDEILFNDLYKRSCFEHNRDHKWFIVELIIEQFIRIRAVNRARTLTLDQHKKFIRSCKTHDIHFAGQ